MLNLLLSITFFTDDGISPVKQSANDPQFVLEGLIRAKVQVLIRVGLTFKCLSGLRMVTVSRKAMELFSSDSVVNLISGSKVLRWSVNSCAN